MKELIKFLDKYNVDYKVEGDYVIADKIYLSNKSIKSLPESIGNLKCYKLSLSYNQLTTLPESFGNLKCNELYLYENKLTTLPESIGNLKCNNLDLSNNQLTSLPESIGNLKCYVLDLYNNNLTTLPKHKKFDKIEIGEDYIFCDYILTHYESIKYVGDYKVYIGYNDEFVVTKDDNTFAHCNTIRQGIRDLLFKLSDRDKSDYENLDLDSKLDIEEAIVMYRILTGACSYGVEQFMRDKEFNKDISIREIDRVIGDSYGSKQFREFFKITT